MNLKETQKKFRELIRCPDQTIPNDFIVSPTSKLNENDRLEIYRTDYFSRFVDALEEIFPTIKRILGSNAFLSVVTRYIEKFPSKYPDLAMLGEKFSEFICQDPLMRDLPFLPDLAQFEWFMTKSFHGERINPVKAETLLAVPPSQWLELKFILQPTLELLKSDWPIGKLWQLQDLTNDEIDLNLDDRKDKFFFVVQNAQYQPEWQEISRQEYLTLKQLQEGKNLESVFDSVLSQEEAPALQRWLQNWLEAGLVVNFEKKL